MPIDERDMRDGYAIPTVPKLEWTEQEKKVTIVQKVQTVRVVIDEKEMNSILQSVIRQKYTLSFQDDLQFEFFYRDNDDTNDIASVYITKVLK